MVILSILMLALAVALAAIIVRLIFNPKCAWLDRIITVMCALALVMGMGAGIANSECNTKLSNLRDEYETINLYYNTIALCENEYVRFDFYQRVNDYNEKYKQIQKNAKSIWVGAFYPQGWDIEILPIEFYLHGDTPYDG